MGELITTLQAARQFKVTATWLKTQARAGTLPHLRVGQKILFNSVALGTALARMAAEFPSQAAIAVRPVEEGA